MKQHGMSPLLGRGEEVAGCRNPQLNISEGWQAPGAGDRIAHPSPLLESTLGQQR